MRIRSERVDLFAMLNRHIPLDTIARWWYVLVAGALLGFIFRLVTGLSPFNPLQRSHAVEGPPSSIQAVGTWISQPGWKDDLLFTVLGFLLACGIIWLLEEIRSYKLIIRQR